MRIAWATDVHLDHASPKTATSFRTSLVNANPDLILIGGDTGEALTHLPFLCGIYSRTQARVCFVLGNHDYYRGSVKQVQTDARKLGEDRRGEVDWLPNVPGGFVWLTPEVALVGEGGWGDWQHGQFSNLSVNDYRLIHELRTTHPPAKKHVATKLGKVSANRLKKNAMAALNAGVRRVIVLTHVPPFVEASWHEDKPGEVGARPFFVWGHGGQLLDALAQGWPGVSFTVLSGHTHSSGVYMRRPNLTVITASARYRRPEIAQVMEVA